MMLPVLKPARYSVNAECPHYAAADSSCRRLTDILGRRVLATGPLCRLHCPTLTEHQMVRRVCETVYEPQFIAKTWAKETGKPTYRVPQLWDKIRDGLSGLRARSDVLGVYLTGSAIVEGKSDPKDVDVAVIVRDLPTFLADQSRRDVMPKEIAGQRMDYFAWTKPHPFFPALDCETKTLYAPTHRYWPYAFSPDLKAIRPTINAQLNGVYYEIALAALRLQTDAATSPETVYSSSSSSGERQRQRGCGCSRNKG